MQNLKREDDIKTLSHPGTQLKCLFCNASPLFSCLFVMKKKNIKNKRQNNEDALQRGNFSYVLQNDNIMFSIEIFSSGVGPKGASRVRKDFKKH